MYNFIKLYILSSSNVDNDVVIISTVVKNGGAPKLHSE